MLVENQYMVTTQKNNIGNGRKNIEKEFNKRKLHLDYQGNYLKH